MPRLHYRRQKVTRTTQRVTKANPTGRPVTTSEEQSNVGVSGIKPPSMPNFTGTPGMVVLAGGTLFIAATWPDFWKPFFNAWWAGGGQAFNPKLSGNVVIGGIVFLIIAAIMASISEEAGGIMVLMILAMWLVFIIFKGGQAPQGKQTSQLQDFFNWFSSGTPATQQQTKPPAQTQTQVPAGKPTRIS